MKRKQGYYWVKWHNVWLIGECWYAKHEDPTMKYPKWGLIGHGTNFIDSDFEEIDETPLIKV